MSFMMCFFPLVGLAETGLAFSLIVLAARFHGIFNNSGLIFALAFSLIPFLITGGIHMDGFMDTCDALASHADREKKLEILKDSHNGAFAMMGAVIYILAYFILSVECLDSLMLKVSQGQYLSTFCLLLFFVLSRSLSSIAVCTFPLAKSSGLVHTFSDGASKKITLVSCIVIFAAASLAMAFTAGPEGILPIAAMVVVFAWYYLMSVRNFGGITGDLAGWFVQVSELSSLAVTALVKL